MSATNLSDEMDLMEELILEGKMTELVEKIKKVSALIDKNLKERKSVELISKLIEKLEQLTTEELMMRGKFFGQYELAEDNESYCEDFRIVFTNRIALVNSKITRLYNLKVYQKNVIKEVCKRGLVCCCGKKTKFSNPVFKPEQKEIEYLW